MNKFMAGNCIHHVWVQKPRSESFLYPSVKEPVDLLANDEDSHYATEFNSWSESNALIEQLRACANEAFGEDISA